MTEPMETHRPPMREPVVRLGRGAALEVIPEEEWWSELQADLPGAGRRFEALSPLQRAVRRAAVLRLVGTGRPVPPEDLQAEVAAPLQAVVEALTELERRLFFLVRDASGAVSWAFPVTADPTPHHLAFASGERLDAAWAEDAFASPFVQGRLAASPCRVRIDSRCALCARPLRIDVDQDLRWSTPDAGAGPLIMEPFVDWSRFAAPTILHAY